MKQITERPEWCVVSLDEPIKCIPITGCYYTEKRETWDVGSVHKENENGKSC